MQYLLYVLKFILPVSALVVEIKESGRSCLLCPFAKSLERFSSVTGIPAEPDFEPMSWSECITTVASKSTDLRFDTASVV